MKKEGIKMNELMNWKLEDMVVSSMSGSVIYYGASYNIKKQFQFDIEKDLSVADKLAVIDHFTDGLGTATLDVINEYECDKNNGTIKKDSWGGLHRGSAKAWVNKHNGRGNIYQGYPENYPQYKMFGEVFKMSLETPDTHFGYKLMWSGSSVVNQWFHLLLLDLKKQEIKYFEEHDEKTLKVKEAKQLAEKFWYFNLPEKNFDKMTLDEVNEYLNKLRNLVNIVEQEVTSL